MKKLMIAASAALCATVGFSVESSNVVGYQNITVNDTNAGGYTWTMSTLPAVGVEFDALTLSTWKVTPPQDGLVSESSVRVNTFDTAGQIAGDYVYLDSVQGSMFGAEPGWYTFESVVNWAPEGAGAVVIDAGEMFQIGSDCGATITVPSAL